MLFIVLDKVKKKLKYNIFNVILDTFVSKDRINHFPKTIVSSYNILIH